MYQLKAPESLTPNKRKVVTAQKEVDCKKQYLEGNPEKRSMLRL